MKRPGNILPIALMAFAIVALLLLIDLSGDVFRNGTVVSNDNTNATNRSTTNSTVPANSNTAVNTNSTVDTDTSTSIEAEWLTFTNETVGYEFMYPGDLKANTCSDDDMAFVSANGIVCDSEGANNAFSFTRQPVSYNQATTITQIKASITNPVTTTTEVDGLSATRVRGVTTAGADVYGGGGKHVDYIFFTKDGRGYTVYANSSTATPFRAEDYETFLTTIIFTE